MKKNALMKDFTREIRRNFGRFFSIFLIIALGAAFFVGIRSTKYDMKYSADQYYDKTGLMDLRVISSLGLTDEDISDMNGTKGIQKAVGVHTADIIIPADDRGFVVHLIGLTEGVNEPVLMKGHLPENLRECLVDTAFLENSGYKIGDDVTFESGSDEPITGSCKRPEYMDDGRGTSTIGDGSTDAFILLDQSAFTSEYYTEAYLQVQGAKNLMSYSTEYTRLIKSAKKNLKPVEKAATKRRYDEIKDEAESQLEKAKDEVTKGEKELTDAQNKLDQGHRQIEEADHTLSQKKQELEDGRDKITDGKKQMQSAKDQIAQGRQQLTAAKGQLEDKQQEAAKAKDELTKQQASYDSGLQSYEENTKKISDLKDQLAKAKASMPEVEQNTALLEQSIADLKAHPEVPGAEDQITELSEKLQGLQEEKAQMDELISSEPQITESEAKLAEAKSQLDTAKPQLDNGWEKLDEGDRSLNAAISEMDKNQNELNQSESELASKEKELTSAEAELSKGEKELADAETKLQEKKDELEQSQREFDEKSRDAKSKIHDAKAEIRDKQSDLDKLEEPSWYLLGRDRIASYSGYEMDADRMGRLGDVFPVMFFLVAALVSLTAMTRMIEEQRVSIGTLKALGYGDFSIAMKYFGYAILATFGGSIFGVWVGSITLPNIIIKAYGILYTGLPRYYTPLNPSQAVLAVLASVLSTGAATLTASYRELKAKPAELMRPEVPKGGKRVLLEHIPFIWHHMNFTAKSTVRNLMRYKKRFLMTTIGIGGCMALILVGFGVQDSIKVVAKRQYTDIFMYDAVVNVNNKASQDEKNELEQLYVKSGDIDQHIRVASSTADLEYKGKSQSVTMQVPEDISKFSKFIAVRDRKSQKNDQFPKEGMILTEKAAREIGAKRGDTVQIKIGDKTVSAKVSVIMENYVLHYIYLSPELYEKLCGSAPEYSQVWLKYQLSDKKEKDLGKALIANKACAGVTFTNAGLKDLDQMLDTLNQVIYVLIISAGLLAFVVLYNLNSINITERQRELATLKVLGFYDREVSSYVFRENIILTVIGIVVGCIMGILLHRFVILTVEVDAMMFGRLIRPISFLVSAVLTMIFSLLVNAMMQRRLKKIDMVESLKSVE